MTLLGGILPGTDPMISRLKFFADPQTVPNREGTKATRLSWEPKVPPRKAAPPRNNALIRPY